MPRHLALAALACLFSTPIAAAQEPRPAIVVLDYTGICGGTLNEARKREWLERKASREIRALRRQGRDVRVMVKDRSVVLGSYRPGAGRPIPVFNRNFGC